MNKTNKNYKRSQKGRSMVEMLGVLAIVGVLSVGGVYGYGVAMKKHKANELLHQASMLATTVSAQILTDKPLNVQDFGDSKYGTFGTPTQVNAEQFTMQITGMDEAVCEQMEKMAGGMVRQAECNDTTLTLTYNNNLSSDKVSADYNGDEDGCKDSGRKYCDNDSCIPSSEECPVTGPTCPTGTTTEGAGGYATTLADNSMCYCETAGSVYKDSTCETKEDNTCSSYADCDKGEYCQFNPSEDCGTEDPTSGVCQSVSGCGLYDLDIGDGKKYTASDYSDCSPDWWTAKDVCASLNMRMLSLSEVGCEDYKDDYCPTDGTVYGALKAKGLKYGFWTTDLYEENNPNSCSAWYVGTDGDVYVSNGDRYNAYDDFLCVR